MTDCRFIFSQKGGHLLNEKMHHQRNNLEKSTCPPAILFVPPLSFDVGVCLSTAAPISPIDFFMTKISPIPKRGNVTHDIRRPFALPPVHVSRPLPLDSRTDIATLSYVPPPAQRQQLPPFPSLMCHGPTTAGWLNWQTMIPLGCNTSIAILPFPFPPIKP